MSRAEQASTVGALALVGGDEFRPPCDPLDPLLLERAGPDPLVAIMPTAAAFQRPDLAGENGRRHFTRLGARAEVVSVLDRQTADDERLVERLAAAALIYLTGGDPWHLYASLAGSRAEAALREALGRGAVVAGSSAGAMVLAEHLRGRQSGWQSGLGLVPGVGVLPHHERTTSAQAQQRLADAPPGAVIVGIAGATGALVEGTAWQVAGRGEVVVYASGQARRYRDGQRVER